MNSVHGIATLLLLATATFAVAHSGHGQSEPSSVLHYLLEPLHLGVAACAAAALVAVLLAVRQRVMRARANRRRD